MSQITTDIDLAIDALRQQKLVAIPTETVYGLAGNALNHSAVEKIFAMKQRPLNHPLILHVAKQWDLSQWVSFIPNYAQQLMKAFWPGPLSLVMSMQEGAINPLITGGQNTIAIRCPAHPMTTALLNAVNFPLVAPSANPFGKISPTTAQHVLSSFPDEELLILDGGRCQVGIESTIVSATHPKQYHILRHGMIDEQQLHESLSFLPIEDNTALRVPGKLACHYQPQKPLYCFTTLKQLAHYCQTRADIYILSFAKNSLFPHQLGYQLPQNPDAFAFELYYQLREADASSASSIALELPSAQSNWSGIRERLHKAASHWE